MGLRMGLLALILPFISPFFCLLWLNLCHSFLRNMLTLKIFVGVFSGIFEARMLKLGIHMDNQGLYWSIENGTPCSYSSLYLSIFLSFMANLCHSFLRNGIS